MGGVADGSGLAQVAAPPPDRADRPVPAVTRTALRATHARVESGLALPVDVAVDEDGHRVVAKPPVGKQTVQAGGVLFDDSDQAEAAGAALALVFGFRCQASSLVPDRPLKPSVLRPVRVGVAKVPLSEWSGRALWGFPAASARLSLMVGSWATCGSSERPVKIVAVGTNRVRSCAPLRRHSASRASAGDPSPKTLSCALNLLRCACHLLALYEHRRRRQSHGCDNGTPT